jgi:hypothetical protein
MMSREGCFPKILDAIALLPKTQIAAATPLEKADCPFDFDLEHISLAESMFKNHPTLAPTTELAQGFPPLSTLKMTHFLNGNSKHLIGYLVGTVFKRYVLIGRMIHTVF